MKKATSLLTGLLLATLLASACEAPVSEADVAASASPTPAAAPTDARAAPGKVQWRKPRDPVAPPAALPPANSPEYFARVVQDRAYAEGRGLDQASNPAYLAATAPLLADYAASGQTDQKIRHDPFRLDWGTTRGMEQDVEFLNRYGARLKAKLWGPKLPHTDPLTGVSSMGPFPTVMFIPGAGLPAANSTYYAFADYEAQLQQLAENGYVVLAVAPQGQDGSEYFVPPHPLCDPNGAWRQPQEMGLQELGECAGQQGPLPRFTGENAVVYNLLGDLSPDAATVAFLLQLQLDEEGSNEAFVGNYDSFRTRFVFPALDGADWLLSGDNPWRTLVDEKRLGITGHSAGADAALVAGNGDPKKRFKAIVTWDGYGLPPETVPARVPTLLQVSEEQNAYIVFKQPPANHFAPAYRNYQTLADAKVPTMLVALRGSNHAEWSYIPYAIANPIAPLTNASSEGGQVAHYYTLAWFDRWLKLGRNDPEAERRLLARQFDGSADRTAIGSGTYDAVTQSNVPYRLAGETVAEHLSALFLSGVAFGGVRCDDWQAGCAN